MIITPWVFVTYMLGEREAWLATQLQESRQREYQLREAQLLEAQMRESQMAQTIEELQSVATRYEALLIHAERDSAAINSLEEQLRQAEDRFSFIELADDRYPNLRVQAPDVFAESHGIVYLTFDDGPGVSTGAILDILDRYQIKATFFLVGSMIRGREGLINRMVEAGHNVGVHSYSHIYRDVYQSVDAYLDDFALASDTIEEVSGIKPDIFRFPGGSINAYNARWRSAIISEMMSRGYRYYDWNVGSGDTAADVAPSEIVDSVVRQVRRNPYGVVLLHDGGGGRSRTVEALPLIIDRLRGEGYRFDRLTNRVRPTVFGGGTNPGQAEAG